MSVATGGYWIGMACARRKVLYVDLETDRRTLQKRIAEVTAAKGALADDVRENLAVWPLRGQSCGLHQIVEELFVCCSPGQFGVVVIDHAYMIQRVEQDNADKLAKLEAACDRLIGTDGSCLREDVERELVWSASTVKRWVDKSDRFERVGAAGAGKSKIVRRSADDEG